MLLANWRVSRRLDDRCADFGAELSNRLGRIGAGDGSPRAMFALCNGLEASLTQLEIQLTDDLRQWPETIQQKACDLAKVRIRDLEKKVGELMTARVSKPEEKTILANHIHALIERSAKRLGVPGKA